MDRFLKASALILLSIVLLSVWYVMAVNYDYAALAGTYVLNQNGDTCTLRLQSNRTFKQELIRAGKAQSAEGAWYRNGEAGVSFSREFLMVAGEQQNASGEAHGWFNKQFGLLTTLTLAPKPGGPTLRKKLFE